MSTEKASRQLEQERSQVQLLQQQLASATSRADVAEQQVQQHLDVLEELQLLRTEAGTLLTAKQESEEQCKALQEQFSRWGPACEAVNKVLAG
jgi:DNA repair exonuclease SbcCD ATPase subunit